MHGTFRFILLLLALNSCTSKTKDISISRPNVLIIMVDDLGYETIGANGGHSYSTPNIDKLADGGIRFEHCYAQPLCTPSRVKIMTGIYNVRNYLSFGVLDSTQTTFGHLFQTAGYRTCVIGKWQLGKDPFSPQRAGFDEHCLWQVRRGRTDSIGRDTRFSGPVLETNGTIKTYSSEKYGPDIVSNYGLDFIERSVAGQQPFLLYYPMILTHCPFSPTPDSPDWLSNDTSVMQYKGEPIYFTDMVKYMDKIVGHLNKKLFDLGIQENTIVLFTGDNGTDLPIVSKLDDQEVAGAKGQSTDAGTRVPLIIRWPETINPNTTSLDLIDFSDILPTICGAANVPIPKELKLDGQSFLPQLKGQIGHPRNWIYNWYSRDGSEENAKIFARNQQYKLYADGSFYNIPMDYSESAPIPLDSLNQETKPIYRMLFDVIKHYQSQRLDNIPN